MKNPVGVSIIESLLDLNVNMTGYYMFLYLARCKNMVSKGNGRSVRPVLTFVVLKYTFPIRGKFKCPQSYYESVRKINEQGDSRSIMPCPPIWLIREAYKFSVEMINMTSFILYDWPDEQDRVSAYIISKEVINMTGFILYDWPPGQNQVLINVLRDDQYDKLYPVRLTRRAKSSIRIKRWSIWQALSCTIDQTSKIECPHI